MSGSRLTGFKPLKVAGGSPADNALKVAATASQHPKGGKLMKTMLIALAMIGPVLAGTPAAAEKVTVTISFEDLNLATAQGQRTLEQRIDIAAKRVCGFHDHITGTRVRGREIERCYAHAKAQGMRSFAAIISASHRDG